jgi:hypothetical protein
MSRTARVLASITANLTGSRVAAAGLRVLAPLERAAQRAVLAAVMGHATGASPTGADPLASWPGADRAAAALRAAMAPYDVDAQWAALGEIIAAINSGDAPTAAPSTPAVVDMAAPSTSSAAPTGPTELILHVLAEAAAPLYAYQIVERVQAVDPCITSGHLNTVLYRLLRAGRVERRGSRCSYRYSVASPARPVPAPAPPNVVTPPEAPRVAPATAPPEAPVAAPVAAPTDGTGPGITEIVFTVLRAAGVPLTKPQIVERVRQIDPRFSQHYIAVTLYRQRTRKSDSPILCHGSRGTFTYTLRSEDRGLPYVSRAVGPSVAANGNAATGSDLREKLLAELTQAPTSDYRALARTLLGTEDRNAIGLVRDRVYWLRQAGRVRRRSDGAWEVPVPQ